MKKALEEEKLAEETADNSISTEPESLKIIANLIDWGGFHP